ncbi:hypothetical protein BURK1_01743 [Burkholderiales bacterium]|nr:hypothetical protein BURK1_01743 [Burkholderiales bacterium]
MIAAMSPGKPGTPAFPAPDLAQARHFLNVLDPGGIFAFQTFSDREELKRAASDDQGRVHMVDPLARVFQGPLEKHATVLAELNWQGAGVFVMINEGDGIVQKGRKTCRTNGNVIRVRANWVDLDAAPIEPVLAAPIAPLIVVESSPGKWHAYWPTACPLDQFESVQLALATHFGGDPSVVDLARVMRLPGFFHNKNTTPVMTRLVRPGTEGVL